MAYSDLRQVPSQYIVQSMDRLPPCGPGSRDEQLEIDVPYLGCFTVTFRARQHTRRGWPATWIWLPSHAVRLASREERRP
jgi:hypothetical protein